MLISYGHLLHGINSMEKLQYIINKNSHPVDVIPNNLEHSIQLYKWIIFLLSFLYSQLLM